jgi:hypothetical protein
MESNGLSHAGILFPEFKDAATWRDHALQRQREEIDAQVYPDGTQRELAPGYHNVALTNFLGTLKVARQNNVPVPAGYAEAMEKMFDVNVRAMLPDRTMPNFNDSGRTATRTMLQEGVKLFPNRDDWRWVLTDGKEGHEPRGTSDFLPYAGWAVMRTGWQRDATCLVMDAGPFGMGHQHEDKLNFILDAYGSHLVAECGIFTYDASDMRRYALGPRAHNLVFVDGMGQHRRGAPGTASSPDGPAPRVTWASNADFDYAAGSFGEGLDERWGPKRVTAFVHRRQVLFVRPEYFVVVDTVRPNDEAEHEYESTFHLDAPGADVDPSSQTVRTTNPAGKANLVIYPVAIPGLGVRVDQGVTSPEWRGWVSDNTYNRRPVPTPAFTAKAKGEVRLVYVFCPIAPNGEPVVQRVERETTDGTAVAAKIFRRDGKADRVTLNEDGTLHFTAAGGKTFPAATSR